MSECNKEATGRGAAVHSMVFCKAVVGSLAPLLRGLCHGGHGGSASSQVGLAFMVRCVRWARMGAPRSVGAEFFGEALLLLHTS